MAFKASYSSIPYLTAKPALKPRYCCGTTGESVIIAILFPAFCKIPGVLKVKFFNSYFDLLDKVGPTRRGKFASLSLSAIKWPSVACSKVASKSNSLTILKAVRISSARWAWILSGISLFITGSIASSFMSKAGSLLTSPLAASFLLLYSTVLKSNSLSSWAVRILDLILPSL